MPGGPRPAAAPLAGADDVHRAGLVEAQQLAEAQLEPGGDAAGDLQRRARLAALDLAEHRGADARAQREVAQREVHRLAQGAHARPDVDGGVSREQPRYKRTLSHTAVQAKAVGASSRRPFRVTRVPGFVAPDVLVLAGGGVIGEAWMTGLLAGIEDEAGADLRSVEAFVGTSAGAIVAARLARASRCAGRARAGAPPARARPKPGGPGLLRTAARWGWAATSPLAPVATALSAPGGALVRSAMLARAPDTGRTLAGACTPRSSARARASTAACGCAASTSARVSAWSSARRALRAPAWPTR